MNTTRARGFMKALIEQVRAQEFPYEPRTPTKRDWSAYDKAQVNEVNDMLRLIRRSVDRAWAHTPDEEKEHAGPGQPPKPAPDVAKAILVQQYFQASNRQAEGLVNLFREKLGITTTFSYKTIERGYEYDHVAQLIDRVFEETLDEVCDQEEALAIDGTGLPTSMKTNYESSKSTKKTKGKKAAWDYLVSSLGTRTGMFTGFHVLDHPHDSEPDHFECVLPEPGRFPNLQLGVADAGFLSRANVQALHELGMVPRIFPKRNSSFKSHGSSAWAPMLRALVKDPWTWLSEYHVRSLAESGYSGFKRDFPVPLRRRVKLRRVREAKSRRSVFNLKRLNYLSYTEDWALPLVRGT